MNENTVKTHSEIAKLSEAHVLDVRKAANDLGFNLNDAAAAGHNSGYFKGYHDAMKEYSQFATQETQIKSNEVKTEKAIDLITGALPYIEEKFTVKEFSQLCTYIDSYLEKLSSQFTPAPVSETTGQVGLEALKQIEQMSDCGDPLTAVIRMKQIATKALAAHKVDAYVPTELNESQWCKLHSGYYGEEIDRPEQLVQTRMTGRELFEYCQHIVRLSLQPVSTPATQEIEIRCNGCGCNKYRSEINSRKQEVKQCINCHQWFILEGGEVFDIESPEKTEI